MGCSNIHSTKGVLSFSTSTPSSFVSLCYSYLPLRVLWHFPNTRKGTLLPNGIRSSIAKSFLGFRQNPRHSHKFPFFFFNAFVLTLWKDIALFSCLCFQAYTVWLLFQHSSWYLEPIQSAVFIVPVINTTIPAWWWIECISPWDPNRPLQLVLLSLPWWLNWFSHVLTLP